MLSCGLQVPNGMSNIFSQVRSYPHPFHRAMYIDKCKLIDGILSTLLGCLSTKGPKATKPITLDKDRKMALGSRPLQRKETRDKSEMGRKDIMVERIKPPTPLLRYICDPETWNMNALHGGRLMAIVSFPSGVWDLIDTVD